MQNLLLRVLIPIILAGLAIVVFSERYMEHHKSNLQEGRSYVWNEKYSNALGRLVCELDDEIGLMEKLDERRKSIDGLPPEVLQNVDFGDRIGDDVPYTKSIRDSTEDIREYTITLNQLESDYDDLTTHRMWIGGVLVADGILIFIIRYLTSNSPISSFHSHISLSIVIIIGITTLGVHLYRYTQKKNRLSRFAQRQERNREL